MTLRADLLLPLFALAFASFACRAGGFWLMRFVTVTPRLRTTLAAAPLAVMIGIVTPAALRGGVAEITGLAATFVAMPARIPAPAAKPPTVAACAVPE